MNICKLYHNDIQYLLKHVGECFAAFILRAIKDSHRINQDRRLT